MGYEVFIVYRERDDKERLTVDSTIAKGLYDKLTEAGFKVFCAPMTAEAEANNAIESAQIMLVLGSKVEYFETESVKGIWKPYTERMVNDIHRILIPCYRNMALYEMPLEFTQFTTYDMSRANFEDFILNFVKNNIIDMDAISTAKSVTVETDTNGIIETSAENNVENAIDNADEELILELVEDSEAELKNKPVADSIMQAFLAKEACGSIDEYFDNLYNGIKLEGVVTEACREDYDHVTKMTQRSIITNYLAENEIKPLFDYDRTYTSYMDSVRAEVARINAKLDSEEIFVAAQSCNDTELIDKLQSFKAKLAELESTKTQEDEAAREKVKTDYSEFLRLTDTKAQKLYDEACRKQDADYQDCMTRLEASNSIEELELLRKDMVKLGDYHGAKKLMGRCEDKIIDIRQSEENARIAKLRAQEAADRAKKRNIILAIVAGVVVVAAAVVVLVIL